MRFSVCTPTYNRRECLHRVYESLASQTLQDFEWIVIDDGSKDETRELIEDYQRKASFPVRYQYQENQGKHVALNRAVELAKGEFIVVADSDDTFLENALEALDRAWEAIPEEKKAAYRGVTCRCYDPETGEKIGADFPKLEMDLNELDAKFKYDFQFEMWGMIRREVMRQYPFPEPAGERLRFFPESVIWDRMAREYQTRYIDVCLRGYYRDQANATTARKQNRAAENIWLWLHMANELTDYYRYKPLLFLKAYVGYSRDGIRLNRKYGELVRQLQGAGKRVLFTLLYPCGYLLSKR